MAGTVTVTTSNIGSAITKYQIAWVSDASGVVSANTISIKIGLIISVKYIPNGGGTAPSDLYDLVLTDADGVDVLAGGGANLAAATASLAYPSKFIEGGDYTLGITNSGNAKGGTVVFLVDSKR